MAADLESDETLDKWMMQEAHTYSHISCTCKMGPESNPMAVTGQDGKVHGIEGLRIVDASIMPEIVNSNTHATVVMLAEKASDMILGYAN